MDHLTLEYMCRCAACKNHFLKHFWGRATDTRIEAWALLRFPGRNRMKQEESKGPHPASIFILFQLVLAVHKTVFNMSCLLLLLLLLFVGSPFYANCKRSARKLTQIRGCRS